VILGGIELNCGVEPRLYKQAKGPLLLLGSSPSIFEDLKEAKMLLRVFKIQYDTMAVNLSFLPLPGRLTHLVSLHQEKIGAFHELAKTLPESRAGHIHTHSWMECPDVECAWPIVDRNGTSGLFALKIAYLIGYDPIITCGLEIEGPRRFYDSPYEEQGNNFSCSGIEYSWAEYKWLPYYPVSGKLLKYRPQFEKEMAYKLGGG
jgi:hypothetical protein